MSKHSLQDFPRISRTVDAIRSDIYLRLESVQDAYAAQGFLPRRLNLNKGVIRGLIELFSWGQFQLYALMQRVLQQAVPYYATGKWADLHAQSVGLTRHSATKARGVVRMYRNDQVGIGNLRIQAGKLVRTLPDGTGEIYRYVTTEDAVLPSERAYVDVLVESETYGASANASAGQICELVTPVFGIARVDNIRDWLVHEGADEETDTHLAERIRLRWMANNGCTKYAYESWALSVPGVSSVTVLDQHPRGQGTVDIVVRGSAVLPTEALLTRVREAIAPNVPINDDWLVKAPIAKPCTIIGDMLYATGDPERLLEAAQARIRALFADKSPYPDIEPLQIGQDVTLSLLTYVVMGVEGIKAVRWMSPEGDLAVAKDSLAVLERLNLSAVLVGEA